VNPVSVSAVGDARARWFAGGVLACAVALAGSGCTAPRLVVLEDPLSSEEHLALGVAYEREGNRKLARAEYEAVLRRRSDHVVALVNLGNLAVADGAQREAEAWYRRAVRLGGPPAAPAANNLAWIYLTQGKRLATAASLVRDAIVWDPRPEYFDTYVAILIATGKLLEAGQAIDEAQSQWPDDPTLKDRFTAKRRALAEFLLTKGKALLGNGRLASAEPLLREAARSDPDRAASYLGALAHALLVSERLDEAVRVIADAETRSSRIDAFADTKRELAEVAHTRGQTRLRDGRLESAETLVREALRWDPARKPQYLDTLAQVLIAQDKPYEAGVVIDEADALIPSGDAELRARLYDRKAELFASRGLTAEAKAAAQQADALRKVTTP